MSVSQFSLLIQAAGTALLLFLFLLLYQKIHRPAFLDWIASWSFLLAGVAQSCIASALMRFRDPAVLPAPLQYAGFAILLLEMMIAVGIILLLFEASQSQLAVEMGQLRRSDELLRELSLRDPLTG